MHATSPSPFPRLQARNLSARVPGESGPRQVLDQVSFELQVGELVDLTGPSGAGKSMLLRALARLLPEVQGQLFLDGQEASQHSPFQWRAQVALVPQKPVIVPGTVRTNLHLPWTFQARAQGKRPGDDMLRQQLSSLGLEDIELERDASRLSVGQQARLAFLRVLLTTPKILLLDEVEAALDEASIEKVRQHLRTFLESGGSILRSRHRTEDGLAQRHFRIEGGRLQEVQP